MNEGILVVKNKKDEILATVNLFTQAIDCSN